MKVLHLVKTSYGARWAALQASILSQLGIRVHVVIPSSKGDALVEWEKAGAQIHIANVSLPVREPWRWPSVVKTIRELVKEVSPDLIHSHFVTTTLSVRLALGRKHPIPRIFQVPGPLHLEHWPYRLLEIKTAGDNDYWIASSRYTQRLYARFGVPLERLFLSYYGFDVDRFLPTRSGSLRQKLGLPSECKIVGNMNYIYAPKYFLGQFTGLKAHEDIIEALSIVCRQRPDVMGVLIGGQWGGGDWYERYLRRHVRRSAGNRVIFVGRVQPQVVHQYWPDFDCAVHVPISENCGGVVEPLLAGVPTIGGRVGGIPEVVFEGRTGWLVPPRKPRILAQRILEVLSQPGEARRRAMTGRHLVQVMFDLNRTAQEIKGIYHHIIDSAPRPAFFDSENVLNRIEREISSFAFQSMG